MDATSEVTKFVIDVTATDISQGRRGSAYDCPVALAMSRALGLPVLVTGFYFVVLGTSRFVRFDIPRVSLFTFDFDDGRPVQPFSFTVQV
jgi:hypothetical protein